MNQDTQGEDQAIYENDDYGISNSIVLEDKLIDWRRDFHMHPELAGEEVRTSGIVAEKLAENFLTLYPDTQIRHRELKENKVS